MQMEKTRWIRSPDWLSDDAAIVRATEPDRGSATATPSALNGILNTSPETPPSPPSSSSGGGNFIEHRVSKMDTLAGVAIKYGVEIADIKRMNGLVTDLQMFAHKSLRIPLPGRHPPSPILSNGSASHGDGYMDYTPIRRSNAEVFDSFSSLKLNSPPRKVSPAMSSLQGYYGLSPVKNGVVEGMEMTVYKTSRALSLDNDPLPRSSPASDPVQASHPKPRSLVNGFQIGNGKLNDEITNGELYSPTPVKLMKADNGSTFSSGRTGNGLALRNKMASRVGFSSDAETGSGDPLLGDGFLAVRKSSSTSNLQDSESNVPSLWSTGRWNLKSDLQALSTGVIARPIVDGLPKPMTVRRKAALD